MVTYSLKRSYRLKDLEETDFRDLWGNYGIFTTMWIFGKPPKILFFESHIKNLIKSLQIFGIKKKFLKKDILQVINKNLSINKRYNHLLRIAINKKIISISLRDRIPPKLDFNLKLVNLKREKPQHKNLKYKKILSYLIKMDNSKSDIALANKKKILETGTSNLLFIKDNKVYSPPKNYYEGNTLKFLKTKIKRIIKKDILLKEINEYDEIILIGSGKGVASVKTINDVRWKRKSLKIYNLLKGYYLQALKNYPKYK